MSNKEKKIRVSGITAFPMRTSYMYWAAPFVGIDKKGKALEPSFQVSLLIPKNTAEGQQVYNQLRVDMENVCAQMGWGADKVFEKLKDGDTAVDAHNQPLRVKRPEVVGHYLARFTSKVKPVVVNSALQPLTEGSVFQSGDYGKVSYTITTHDYGQNVGLSLYFDSLQFCYEGTRFSGAPTLEQAAAKFGAAQQPAPMAQPQYAQPAPPPGGYPYGVPPQQPGVWPQVVPNQYPGGAMPF